MEILLTTGINRGFIPAAKCCAGRTRGFSKIFCRCTAADWTVTVKNFYKNFCKAEEIICATGFFAIVCLTFASAIFRQLKLPLTWADDVSQLLFAWVAFMGADVAMRYSRLVGVDILMRKLPGKLQKLMQIVVFAIMIVFLVILVIFGFQLGIENSERNFQSLVFLSYSWVTYSLPVCGILMIITASTKIFKLIRHFSEDSYELRKDTPDAGSTDNERQIM